MNSAIERLLTLRVCDIMNSPVATVDETASMADAARILAEHQVSGLPVVDSQGRCVGIISTTDFAERECRRAGAGIFEPQWSWQGAESDDSDEETRPRIDSQDQVGDHMSSLVQTVDENSPIMTAARLMCREHIHRLVIVDQNQVPVGVVSSLDLVAATVAAVEE